MGITPILLWAGCSPVSVDMDILDEDETTTSPQTTTTSTPSTTTTSSSTSSTTSDPTTSTFTTEVIGDQPSDDTWIFDDDVIHEINITLPTTSVQALYAEPYEYTEGSVSFDGIEFDLVGVRLRGKVGSFRDLSGKPKLRIDLNQYVEDQRLDGQESITLNNSVVDCSFMKEPLAYRVFRAMGVPAPRTSFARVRINDSDYGLYVLIETPDDRFLDRHYPQDDGNLYDGKYLYYEDGSYNLLDFGVGDDTNFELEEGTDVGHTDIMAISDALLSNNGAISERMAPVLDWDIFQREQLSEQWVGQNDGYGLNTNNYRVYFNPETGLAEILPYDMDYSFLEDSAWGRSWRSPAGNIAAACMRSSDCEDRQAELALELIEVVETLDLFNESQEMLDVIDEDVATDPRRECSDSYVRYYQDLVVEWVVYRSNYIIDFWDLD